MPAYYRNPYDATGLVTETTAALSAYSLDGLPDGTVAYVRSLRDFFELRADSAATADADDYVVIATSGDGRWHRLCYPNAEWLTTTTWYIDPATGDNENSGSASDEALKSWSELARRLRGLAFNTSTVTVNIVTSLANTDPVVVNFDVFNCTATPTNGSLVIAGSRTTAASGTLSAVTNIDPTAASGGQANEVTMATGHATAYVHKLVRFLNGASFRTAAWIAKDLGSDVARISPAVNNDNNTAVAQTNPVNGDSYEIYTLPTAPGFACSASFRTIVQVRNLDFTPTGSSVFGVNDGGAIIRFQGCSFGKSFSMRMLAGSATFYNCLMAGGGTLSSTYGANSTMIAGLVSGSLNSSTLVTFEGRWLFNNQSTSPSTMFQGLTVQFNVCQVDDGRICIFESPASATSALRLLALSKITLIDLWGLDNAPTSTGVLINKYGQELTVLNTLNLDHSAVYDVGMGHELVFKLFADMTNRGDFRDIYGNVMRAPGGGDPDVFGGYMSSVAPAMYNCGEDMVPARVVRVDTGAVVKAQADTAAHATGVVGVSTSQNTSGGRVVVVSSGYAVLKFDADPTDGSLAYLSAANAGQATSTVPAVSGTNQKLRLGYVLRAFGGSSGLAVVRLQPELVSNTSDGASP